MSYTFAYTSALFPSAVYQIKNQASKWHKLWCKSGKVDPNCSNFLIFFLSKSLNAKQKKHLWKHTYSFKSILISFMVSNNSRDCFLRFRLSRKFRILNGEANTFTLWWDVWGLTKQQWGWSCSQKTSCEVQRAADTSLPEMHGALPVLSIFT